MGAAPIAVEVFCSYANADEAWQQKLETHLSLLRRQGLVSLWHEQLIRPGVDWAATIDTHLETASVILLLVSADFLASDYCYSIEMKRALERHAVGEARVVPILVRPVDWTGAPFAHLRALPTDAKPISSWQDEDRALADVAAGIRRVIEDVLSWWPVLLARLCLLCGMSPTLVIPSSWAARANWHRSVNSYKEARPLPMRFHRPSVGSAASARRSSPWNMPTGITRSIRRCCGHAPRVPKHWFLPTAPSPRSCSC